MSTHIKAILRGVGGTACAASTMVAIASFAGGFSSYAPATATAAQAQRGAGTSTVDTTTGPATSSPSASASLGTDNRGHVWVDTVTNDEPMPEMDPHLPCDDFYIWGTKLNDSGGTFTIQGWPPSGGGAKDVDYAATWSFDTSNPNSLQKLARVDHTLLIATAIANGDVAQPQQGFHFKLDLEDPRSNNQIGDDKYKVFWINCPAPTPTGTVLPTATPSPTPTPTSSVAAITSTPAPTPTPTPSGGIGGLATPTPTPVSGVLGASITTPNTGSGLPLGISGALMGFGLTLLAIARRMRTKK